MNKIDGMDFVLLILFILSNSCLSFVPFVPLW